MHIAVFVAGAFLTLLLAGPAVRGGLPRAWLLLAATVVPVFLLYMGFRGSGNDALFLWPTFLLASIIVVKSLLRLYAIVSATPRAAINTSGDHSQQHWATTA